MSAPMIQGKAETEKKTVTKDIQLWTDDCKEELRDCLEETDWQIFSDSYDNLHELTDVITSYIMFCESNTIHTETVRIFPNNKLWITSNLKGCINEKKLTFTDGNVELVREKICELRCKL